MNEEIDETEFYHHDFTTASAWEIFIANVEEIVIQWKSEDLTEPPERTGPWNIKRESIQFADANFDLLLYRKNIDIVPEYVNKVEKKSPFDTYYSFGMFNSQEVAEHSCLSRWYGINDYIVLSTAGNISLTCESKIKMLLSSLYVVAGSGKCEYPLFVQIREKWQNCYLGVYENERMRTNLEMVHLKTSPRLCQYLSGMLELFRSKIYSSTFMTTILMSLKLTYVLTDFGNFVWKQEYINPDSENFNSSVISILPFGVTVDPIESIILKTSWSNVGHGTMQDSESNTDFVPMRAPEWSSLITSTEQPLCLLGECLNEFYNLSHNNNTVYEVLGDFLTVPTPEVNNPLDLLTESKVPTISALLSRAARRSLTSNKRGTAPLSEDVLVPILYYLFPDADKDSSHPYMDNSTNLSKAENIINLENECRGMKTCDQDSLLWRLVISLGHAVQALGGVRAFSHIWFEFVQEMRYRWDKSISILGLLPGYPDLRTSLLHQKLQMLNCCIERKQARENPSLHFESAEGSSSDEEEFFDCADLEEEARKKAKHSLWNQPMGRLGKFNSLKLLKTGEDLYIPITQEPVPKTEDQLEEDTNVLLKLGSDAQGSEMRAKMMSASLLSDMESFKAANPGSILEDFIRWYSPRDWIETDELDEWNQKKGQLSARMMIEDNFWMQTWKTAKPVPANRQKRLFDDTREAEKVLHFLDSRNISQITEMLFPILSEAAIYRLTEECQQISSELSDADSSLRALIKSAERITRENSLHHHRCEAFIHDVTALELKVSQVNSLLYKFSPTGTVNEDLSQFVSNLIRGLETRIVDESRSVLGKRIVDMFSNAQRAANMIPPEPTGEDGQTYKPINVFPQHDEKEIVLRVTVPRPAIYSSECPQFLRSILNKNEFRLVGAFAEDIVFF